MVKKRGAILVFEGVSLKDISFYAREEHYPVEKLGARLGESKT